MRRNFIILFWKLVAIVYDYRPRNIPQKYADYPIAWKWDNTREELEYPEHIKILYEWREGGKYWIVYTR